MLPIEKAQDRIARRIRILLHFFPGTRRYADEREAWRAAEAFVRPGNEQIGTTRIRTDIHAAERRDRIDEQIGAVRGDDPADLLDRIDGAGRGIVVAHGDDTDVRPRLEQRGDARRIDDFVVGHADLEQFRAVAPRPKAEPRAVDAGDEIEHDVLLGNQRRRTRLEREYRLALQNHRHVRGAQRRAQLFLDLFVKA